MTDYDLGLVVGKGISNIAKTGTSGLVDTYTITFTDNTTTTFNITNGAKGDTGATGQTGAKGDKGDKGDTGNTGATGNGISSISKTSTSGLVDTYTISFTDGTSTTFTVTNGSDASITVDSALSSSSTNPVQNKIINSALNSKASSSHTHTESQITDLGNYIEKSNTVGLVKNDGTIDTTTYLSSLPSHNHDDRYYTETEIDNKLTNKVNTSDIVNNLTTTVSGKVLDARQGKALADLIGSAITYINQ